MKHYRLVEKSYKQSGTQIDKDNTMDELTIDNLKDENQRLRTALVEALNNKDECMRLLESYKEKYEFFWSSSSVDIASYS